MMGEVNLFIIDAQLLWFHGDSLLRHNSLCKLLRERDRKVYYKTTTKRGKR